MYRRQISTPLSSGAHSFRAYICTQYLVFVPCMYMVRPLPTFPRRQPARNLPPQSAAGHALFLLNTTCHPSPPRSLSIAPEYHHFFAPPGCIHLPPPPSPVILLRLPCAPSSLAPPSLSPSPCFRLPAPWPVVDPIPLRSPPESLLHGALTCSRWLVVATSHPLSSGLVSAVAAQRPISRLQPCAISLLIPPPAFAFDQAAISLLAQQRARAPDPGATPRNRGGAYHPQPQPHVGARALPPATSRNCPRPGRLRPARHRGRLRAGDDGTAGASSGSGQEARQGLRAS